MAVKKQPEVVFEELDGHELLKKPAALTGTMQARLLARASTLTDDADTVARLDQLADLVDWVTDNLAVSPDKFRKWTVGDGGMERSFSLVMAYVNEVGKLASSGY